MIVPALQAIGSSVFVVYPASEACAGISLEFARIVDHKDTLTAEVTITTIGAGEVAWSRVNLTSAQGRNALSKTANDKSPEAPWPDVVNNACRMVARHLRAGEPALELVAVAATTQDAYLIPGLVPKHKTTILFGDGGSGKSLLALATALYGVLGHPLSARWTVAPIGRALYLDWESDRQDHEGRLWGLTRGLEEAPPGRLYYRRFHRPLTDHLDAVQADVARLGVDFVVCDSLGAAGGDEPESADAAIRTLMALRSLDVTVVAVAHVSKMMADSGAPARPFGSVYVANLARSTIEARRQETAGDDRELVISLYQRKSNTGPLSKPSALGFAFDHDGKISCHSAQVDMTRASLPARILDELRAGEKNAQELAEAMDATVGAVRARLGDLKNARKVIQLGDHLPGRGKKGMWGLPLTKRTADEP